MKLTPTEQRLLERLQQGRAAPEELLTLLPDELATLANLHVHISNLRKKTIVFQSGEYGLAEFIERPKSLDLTGRFDSTSAIQ